MQNNDVTVRRKSYAAAKEIKASAHYAYVVNGITLDGSKFETGGFVEEGTCLVKDNTTGKYEPYKDTASAFPTGKSDPVILDGQVLVHGAVYESLLVGCTAAFKTAVGAAIRFV